MKIFSIGILLGVSVQIFPFTALKGFSRNDSLVHFCICFNPANNMLNFSGVFSILVAKIPARMKVKSTKFDEI